MTGGEGLGKEREKDGTGDWGQSGKLGGGGFGSGDEEFERFGGCMLGDTVDIAPSAVQIQLCSPSFVNSLPEVFSAFQLHPTCRDGRPPQVPDLSRGYRRAGLEPGTHRMIARQCITRELGLAADKRLELFKPLQNCFCVFRRTNGS